MNVEVEQKVLNRCFTACNGFRLALNVPERINKVIIAVKAMIIYIRT